MLFAGESIISVLGVFGRSRPSTVLSKAATKRRLTAKAKLDVDESVQEISRLQSEINNIRTSMEQEINNINSLWETRTEEIETYSVKPKKGYCTVEMMSLAWAPYWEIDCSSANGKKTSTRIPVWLKA